MPNGNINKNQLKYSIRTSTLKAITAF